MKKMGPPLTGLELLDRVSKIGLTDHGIEEASRMAEEAQKLPFDAEGLQERISTLAAKRSYLLSQKPSIKRQTMLKHLDALRTVLTFKESAPVTLAANQSVSTQKKVAASSQRR